MYYFVKTSSLKPKDIKITISQNRKMQLIIIACNFLVTHSQAIHTLYIRAYCSLVKLYMQMEMATTEEMLSSQH